MRKIIIASSLLIGAFMVGCGSDGGECCGAEDRALDAKGNPIPQPVAPTAKIDRNITTNVSISENEGKNDVNGDVYTVSAGTVNKEITMVFKCDSSFDNDEFDANENNKSIESCDWNVTMPATRCSGDNISTGSSVQIICTDDLNNEDTVFVKLTVTDDENQTADANTTVKF